MVQKTKNIKQDNVKQSTNATAAEAVMQPLVFDQTVQDTKNAILIVSLMANAFVLIGWIALQVTNIYDYQVAAFLFTR